MTDPEKSLTGLWHGVYSYPRETHPVYFTATLIQSGTHLSGSSHEAEQALDGAPLTLYAMLDGTRAGTDVRFTKTYDGSGGWDHAVAYEGRLDDTATEIDGEWVIRPQGEKPGLSGRFLMIRSAGASEKAVREAFEKV
ncbi:MAG: hypothetical protein WCH83_15585 [Alphaproteobacteria bacterium]|jgi:hypothetical protein